MHYTRMYTGDDDESHFEDVEVELHDHGAMGQISSLEKASGVLFRTTAADYDLDFHNAPRRQFIVNLAGVVEIELGDGTVRRFGSGDILLAEDTTGHGHISRSVEGAERSMLFITLD